MSFIFHVCLCYCVRGAVRTEAENYFDTIEFLCLMPLSLSLRAVQFECGGLYNALGLSIAFFFGVRGTINKT